MQHKFETYNESHKPKCKGKLDYIDRIMNKVPELYEIAAKLFKNDVKALGEEMYSITGQKIDIFMDWRKIDEKNL